MEKPTRLVTPSPLPTVPHSRSTLAFPVEETPTAPRWVSSCKVPFPSKIMVYAFYACIWIPGWLWRPPMRSFRSSRCCFYHPFSPSSPPCIHSSLLSSPMVSETGDADRIPTHPSTRPSFISPPSRLGSGRRAAASHNSYSPLITIISTHHPTSTRSASPTADFDVAHPHTRLAFSFVVSAVVSLVVHGRFPLWTASITLFVFMSSSVSSPFSGWIWYR